MTRPVSLVGMLLLSSVFAFDQQEWDVNRALISVNLAQVAYCGHENYESHIFTGPTEGFVLTSVVYDDTYDINGYVGYLPSEKSIYVTFRGTDSEKNTFIDGLIEKTAYTMWPECNCTVHTGFQMAYLMTAPTVLAEVERLQSIYPDYAVRTTGHSLGAALTHLTSMMLIKNGIEIESMINFGQPRMGDADYAAFSNQVFVNQQRVVHHKDIFPHTPTSGLPNYYLHTRTEIYEDSDGSYRVCDASGEDPTCSNQWHSYQLSNADHYVYMGMCIGPSCRCTEVTTQFLQ